MTMAIPFRSRTPTPHLALTQRFHLALTTRSLQCHLRLPPTTTHLKWTLALPPNSAVSILSSGVQTVVCQIHLGQTLQQSQSMILQKTVIVYFW